ncbi:MAG TPA: OmpA family protein [Bryobacteraceae bacterium]|nr:OmpA family protein [Bryobacteraceae bacterium]
MGKQFAWIAILAALVAGSAFIDYRGYRSLREMRSEVRDLQQQVNEASKLAQQESAAAAAAGERAEAAANRAEIAAQGRQQAEQQKQQAESQREQAMADAQRANQEAGQAQDQMRQMRRQREEELNRMQEALDRVAETHRTPNGMIIVLPNSIFRFEFDSSELSQHNRELLSRIAGILLVSKGYGLSVFGYTDDVGTAQYNQQLSLRRAKAVQDYLIHSGIDPAIINIKGYGKTSPLVAGTNAESRAKNRRVEIALTDSTIKFQ